jgi:micrococcal nuclease
MGETMRRIKNLVLIAVFCALAGCGPRADSRPAAAPSRTTTPVSAAPSATQAPECYRFSAWRTEAAVTRVIDGDSIEVEINGVPFGVRYIGMDAPEMDGGGELAGEARAENLRLVGGRQVVLIRDQAEADRYGRLLRYVLSGGVFVNREIVRLGLARAGSYPPNTTCDAELLAAQNEAALAKRGLWAAGAAAGGAPAGAACPNGCVTPPAGCVIKGNINAAGEKIYHLPGQKYYDVTVIEPEKGERWFCSEAEAIAAGWRKSRV